MIMKTVVNWLSMLAFAGSFTLYSCQEENNLAVISGTLTGHSDCKNKKSMRITEDTPDTLSCVTFLYDPSTRKMQLTHINAGFNCCPGKLWCEVSLNYDTIRIGEYEKEQGCDCNCLFDLEMEISGLEAQQYQIKFIEPYAGEQEPLIFSLDLSVDKEGSHCVIRKVYPWGMN
jgi:hypothetical protein